MERELKATPARCANYAVSGINTHFYCGARPARCHKVQHGYGKIYFRPPHFAGTPRPLADSAMHATGQANLKITPSSSLRRFTSRLMENLEHVTPWRLHAVSEAVTDTNVHEFFEQHGLYYAEDPAAGEALAALDQNDQFNSTDGFGVFLDRQCIRLILEPYLDHENPQVCLPFSADPGHIFAFSTAPETTRRVIVYIWGAGSSAEFYAKSHTKELKGVQASNGLLEIAEASLKRNGCSAIRIQLDKGGMYAFSQFALLYRHLIGIQRNPPSQTCLSNTTRIYKRIRFGDTGT
ncbi:hypothetical protein VFPBJ_11300 [Purpureocillium lilacinum]|uniref:Uncharacterized protein n=1 Tax=Purpureocillium lilacinum TaxID=33203 RepID=A0A179FF61_PURLI|nr:hypothetical protein VFPBJ_11300 [Purpureocillium lilacinum]